MDKILTLFRCKLDQKEEGQWVNYVRLDSYHKMSHCDAIRKDTRRTRRQIRSTVLIYLPHGFHNIYLWARASFAFPYLRFWNDESLSF